MNNFSVDDKFWFYTYSLPSLLVTDFQFDWVSFLITTLFDALLSFWTIQLEKFLPLLVRWRRCLPPRSATPDSVLLFLEILPSRFRQPALAPMRASRSWLAPLASVYRCSQRLPQISLCKLPVHRRISDRRSGDLWCTTSWTVVALAPSVSLARFFTHVFRILVFVVVIFGHTAKLTAQLSQIVISQDLKFGNHCSVFVKTHCNVLVIPGWAPNCRNR